MTYGPRCSIPIESDRQLGNWKAYVIIVIVNPYLNVDNCLILLQEYSSK